MTSLDIPDSVVSVYNYAFNGNKVTDVKIGNGVKGLGGNSFSDCQRLSSVTIGSGVTSIGMWSFSRCPSLKSITFKGKTQTEAEDLLSAAGLPDGCEIKTWNDASKEYVDSLVGSINTTLEGIIG